LRQVVFMAKKLVVKQVRSAIGRQKRQKLTLKALGIKRLNHTVTHDDTPVIRGMIRVVRHLVQVTEE